ncbi:hypothetical protein BGX24_010471 [Mortierella sp. AD032]|nr:hypothetical protein BGX24_010471 [Mortierella sp. AD032]
MAETTTQDVGLVERILEKRVDMDTGSVEYLIRWQGTDGQGNEYEDTWEPEENVLGEELIEEFEQSRPTMRVHPRQPSFTKPNGAMPPKGEPNKHYPSVRYPHPPLPLPAGANRHQRTQGRDHYPEPHLAQAYPSRWQHDGSLRRPGHQQGSYGAPPGYYPPHHASQYPPMHRQSPFPGQFPMQHQPMYSPYGNPGTEGLLSKRNRAAADFTNPSKRKASVSVVEDPESKDMAGVESTVDAEPSGQEEADKRLKAGHELRSYSQSSSYISRRRATGINGKSSTTIRLLQLDHDREKSYFMSVIEKSELIKDAAIRSDVLQFLKDPRSPGLDPEAALLASETWLIELKEQQGVPGSLFLALDIPGATIKALFIPESLLEYQRKQHPGKGLFLNDRSIVSAIIAGDLRGSGLSPAVNGESGSIALATSQQPSLPGSAKNQPEMNGDVSMDVDEPENSIPMITCGWRDCNESRATVQELSLHVHQDHLQNLVSGPSIITHSKTTQNGSGSSQTIATHDADASQAAADVPRDEQIILLQSSYSSLKSDIVRMKEEITRSDQQAQDLGTLYSVAIESSEENIRRLEAQLEWEMKKWDQYRKETRRMLALGGNMDKGPIHDPHPTEAAHNDGATVTLLEQADGLDSESRPHNGPGFDKPMEAQAGNSIQMIQKLLVAAREKQSRLEKQNQELVSKRRALESEHALLDQRYRDTLAQLASLEAKDHDTADALRNRAKGVEQCRTTIDQEQEHSRKVVDQLQNKIDELRRGASSSPQTQPSPPAMNAQPSERVQESETNGDTSGDHIMTDPTSPPAATPVSTLPSQVMLSEGLSPMNVEPELEPKPEPETSTDADSTLEPMPIASVPLDASPSPPPSSSTPPPPTVEHVLESTMSPSSDNISAEPLTTLSTEQPSENSDVRFVQQQEPVSTEADEANPNISVDPSASTSASIEPDTPTADSVAPIAVTDDVTTTIQAVEDGLSTLNTTSPAASALPEKVEDWNETLPSEELSSPRKAPEAESITTTNNNDTPNTTTPTTTTGDGNSNGDGNGNSNDDNNGNSNDDDNGISNGDDNGNSNGDDNGNSNDSSDGNNNGDSNGNSDNNVSSNLDDLSTKDS